MSAFGTCGLEHAVNAVPKADLTKRLRDASEYPLIGRGSRGRVIRTSLLEAADEIERLRTELGRGVRCSEGGAS